MRREIPGSSSQQFCGDFFRVLPAEDRNRNVNDVCVQTGEEFSTHFLRDRIGLRREPDHNQFTQMGSNFNPNHHVINDHPSGFPKIHRIESDSDALEFLPKTGYVTEGENWSYPDYKTRAKWEHLNTMQNPGNYTTGEVNGDRVNLGSTPTQKYAAECSPAPYNPFLTGDIDGSFVCKMKFLCSYGGRILPRPSDGKLRYVGGETRIMSIRKDVTWDELMKKTFAISNQPHTIKYQLPGEDLDALISVCSDEDLHNMIDEYQELERNGGSQRLRIFLVASGEGDSPKSSEGRTPHYNDADYEFVFAFNAMQDASPQNNHCGQPFAIERIPSDNIYCTTSAMHFNKIYQGPPTLVNYHHDQQYFLENDESHKPSDLHFYNHSTSGDFLPHLQTQNDMNTQRPKLKDRAVSDSKLHEHEMSKYYMEEAISPLCLWNDGKEKLPLLAITNYSQEPMTSLGLMSETNQTSTYNNQCRFDPLVELNTELLKRVDGRLAFSDEGKKESEENVPHDNLIRNKSLLNLNRQPLVSNQVIASENFVENRMKHHQDHQTGTVIPTPNILFRNQNLIVEQQCSKKDGESCQSNSNELPRYYRHPSQGSCDLEAEVQNSASKKSSTSPASSKIASFEHHPIENVGIRGQLHEQAKVRDAPKLSDDHHEKKELHPALIVEDVTGTTPPDISWLSRAIPHIEEHTPDESLSPIDSDVDSTFQESDFEDEIADHREIDDSISDATMAEIEAGIYGLQIIKNADVEEVKELGSGTFGTVYYGKWRGTDVAIKRIKKSCFAGRSSEEERLTKDFWREARILSNLHHPNVLAFYGVVPDGPGGTMGTVTEYMVNGSLRNVLQKKERALDLRKKLIIALDAAFGMEYLHLKDIVHFDLKCDNLLVNLRDTQRPICKVGDFGLSRIKRNTLVSGGVRGTLPWMAPELLDGNSNRVSEKVDVYSFGIAMWEILTGEEPYANMHCGAIIGGIVSNTLRPAIPERCDSEWRKLMEECWCYDPLSRPSFTEITNRLRNMQITLQPKRRNIANR
ncbi:uncharacterized protein [Euphorbia lathyris]|uniref:uncharacterized protein n=1 Tax=Euphorbia lathyris TaxID=212925 RepID=UPI003314251D